MKKIITIKDIKESKNTWTNPKTGITTKFYDILSEDMDQYSLAGFVVRSLPPLDAVCEIDFETITKGKFTSNRIKTIRPVSSAVDKRVDQDFVPKDVVIADIVLVLKDIIDKLNKL